MVISDYLIAEAEEEVRSARLRIAELSAFERFHDIMLHRLETERALAARRQLR